MALTQRERNIAMITGAVVGLTGIYFLILTPYFDWRKDALQKLDTVNRQLKDADLTFARQTQMRKIWNEMSANGLKSTPAEADTTLLSAVRDWAHSSEIRSVSVKPERNSQEKSFQTIGYRASGPGSLRSVAQFLWQLESSPIPVRVTDLSVTPRREGLDDLNVVIGVSTLCLAPESDHRQPAVVPQ